MPKRVLALVAAVLAVPALAETPVESNGLGWKASAEFGFVDTSGNTQSTTTNAKLNAVYELPQWRNRFLAEYLQASDSIGTTAKRTVAQGSTNYKLDARNYLFGNLRYEDDEFAPYDYRLSETVGYGRMFRWPDHRLDLEIGAGASHTLYANDERDDEGIVRLAANYVWAFSKTGELSETAFTEIGELNTHSESETALKLRINGVLALKLSYKVLHNTETPLGTENLDSITGVTLVYDFLGNR